MAKRQRETGVSRPGGQVTVQLASRIPKELSKELKLYCVDIGIPIAEFVGQAIRNELVRVRSKKASKEEKQAATA